MGTRRKFDLDGRLDAYFATLRHSSVTEALKRSAENWQIYAAVSGSAIAMATGASAAIIGAGTGKLPPEPFASATAVKPVNSQRPPFMNAVRLAMAAQRPARATASAQSHTQAPSISAGGVVPIFSSVNIIQPGELVSIYGTNLASETVSWNGNFPTSLGGTTVEIDGKAAYLIYASPDMINLQAPDDTSRGTVSVVVTTAAGSATSSVTLSDVAPSFSLLDHQHVSGIILRSNGSGAYGGGMYDILGPPGISLGYRTVGAQPGDRIELYAVGLGPTTPAVPAGQAFSGAAPIKDRIGLYINGVFVKPSFVGLSSAGLYQINLTVPTGLGEGDVPIKAIIGGMRTQPGLVFSLESTTIVGTATGGGSGGVIGGGGTGNGFGGGGGTTGGGGTNGGGGTSGGGGTAGGGGTGGGGSGGGTGGGGGGTGGGGGGSVAFPKGKKPYHPKLHFGPSKDGSVREG